MGKTTFIIVLQSTEMDFGDCERHFSFFRFVPQANPRMEKEERKLFTTFKGFNQQPRTAFFSKQ